MTTVAVKTSPSEGRILSETLHKLLQRSVPSRDVTRPHICTLRFEGGEVISSDGHRIHRLPSPVTIQDCTVPVWALRAALASVEGSTEYVTIEPYGGGVSVSTPAGSVRAEQPKFPPWRQVYPYGAPALEVDLRLSDAVREIRRLRKGGDAIVVAGLLYCPADGPSRDIVRFRAGQMPSAGRALEKGPPDWDVDGPEWRGQIGWQADYLLDALAAAKWSGAKAVTLRVWGELDPALLLWEGGDAVIMPIRL